MNFLRFVIGFIIGFVISRYFVYIMNKPYFKYWKITKKRDKEDFPKDKGK